MRSCERDCGHYLFRGMLAVIVAAVLAPAVAAAEETPFRYRFPLDGNWKFWAAFDEIKAHHEFLAADGSGAQSLAQDPVENNHGWIDPAFDDSAWPDIDLPISWNKAFEDLWSYEGEGWFRKTFVAPADWRDKDVNFTCDGANHRTVVYVNGEKVGVHEGGFLRFSFPIQQHLRWGQKNTIAISVDNISSFDRVPMERHDWWHFGGLYRPVYLEIRPQMTIRDLAIETDALASPPTVKATMLLPIRPAGDDTLRATLMDASGNSATAPLEQAESGDPIFPVRIVLPVENAQLWSPENPVLYTLRLEFRTSSGELADAVERRIGVRSVGVDGSQFLLNGKPYLIKGVNRYENFADAGPTATDALTQHDIDLIKDLGGNAVRCHYPYSPRTYELLDELGLLAVCEVPLYQWGRPGHNEKNAAAALAQLEEMIQNLRNHPSVAFWSISNENRIRPREEGEEHLKLSEMVVRGNQALADRAHLLDPGRPVIEPSNRWPDDVILEKTDLNSINVYLGVEAPQVASLPALKAQVKEQFAAVRAQHPGKPILVTEFGTWALRGFRADYYPGEGYQAELLKTYWEAFVAEPDFAGAFVWVFADSDVHRKFTRLEEIRCAYGLFDIHRQPKAAAGMMRALWRDGGP